MPSKNSGTDKHDPQAILREWKPRHDFFIGVDSDGCAFDAMEIKHKECFIPNTIRYWNLQSISKYVREAAEFVNLYSRHRGENRFPALVRVFDLLAQWNEPMRRAPHIPKVPSLRKWIETEKNLSNPSLKAAVEKTGDSELAIALEWSMAVNRTIEEIVKGVPPFPFVRESFELLSSYADILVVSATPEEALKREWAEHGLSQYTFAIAGQESGKKSEHLTLAAKGKYAPDKILMIGDALGDLSSARSGGAMFYPINPGKEEESWKSFLTESSKIFKAGKYQGRYEDDLINKFKNLLPETPPWVNRAI